MLLGNTSTNHRTYVYRAITVYGAAFQRTSTSDEVSHSAPARQNWTDVSHNPPHATPAGYHTHEV